MNFRLFFTIIILLLVGCSSQPTTEVRDKILKDLRNKIPQEPPPLPPRKSATVGDMRAYFGIHANTCKDFKGEKGAYLVGFYPNSPAKENGIAIGDQIVKFSNKKISSSGDLTTAIKLFPPNDAAAISIVRNGKLIPDILVIGRGYYYEQRENDKIDAPDINSLCGNLNLREP